MRGTMQKSHALRIHAKKRAMERYGLNLRVADLKEIVQTIKDSTSKAVLWRERQSEGRSRVALLWRDVEIVVMYDHRRGEVITFLPPGTGPVFAPSPAGDVR